MTQRRLTTLFCVLALVFTVAGTSLADDFAGFDIPSAPTDADYYDDGAPDPAKVELGRLLFFDKILSGNQNISCATCHHSITDTGDGLSLPVGEGGRGLGVIRDVGTIFERVPRNAPPVFNLGAREFQTMFHDGRVQVDMGEPSGFRSPAGNDLPLGLENVLAAQAMFPVTSGAEMAGQEGENPIADAAAIGDLAGPDGVWALLAGRLRAIPEYRDQFIAVFGDVDDALDIEYRHAANAIAAFEAFAWRADNSPFDRRLRGDMRAMSKAQIRGGKMFYGVANCSSCHSGPFQTDHQFYAICVPQIGPGKGDGMDGHEDFGREQVTADGADRYRFRTLTLRNVALTGPWGHSGAFNTLEAMVRHHLDAVASLESYDKTQVVLPPRVDLDAIDFLVHDDPIRRAAIGAASEITPVVLTDDQISDLLEFLGALTDPGSIDLRSDTPRKVPSGLLLAD